MYNTNVTTGHLKFNYVLIFTNRLRTENETKGAKVQKLNAKKII